MNFSVGDIVQMKKVHPCGGNEWEIIRTGIDFKIKCKKCDHIVMLTRIKFEKGVKKILISINNNDNNSISNNAINDSK